MIDFPARVPASLRADNRATKRASHFGKFGIAYRAPKRGLTASPLTSSSRIARCRCGRKRFEKFDHRVVVDRVAEQSPADDVDRW